MNASSTLPSLRFAAAATLLSLSSLAYAQTPAAAPATPAVTVAPIAQASCVSPGDYPATIKPGQNTIDGFQKKVDAYGTCLKAYVAEQRTAAETSIATAKAHQDAANEAVGRYNDYVTSLNEQAKKANK